MIDVSCLCGKKFRAKPELAGRQVKCPECGQTFVVPSPKPEADDPFLVDLTGFEDQPAADDPLGLGAAGQVPQQPMMQQPMAGYDQFGAYQTPAQPRPRKPGTGKTGLYIGIGVGSVVGVAALIGLVFLVINLFGSPHERLVKKMLGVLDDVSAAIESVKDEASADRAARKLERLSKKMESLQKKAESMSKPSNEVAKRIEEKYKAQAKAAVSRLMKAMMGLAGKPALAKRMSTSLSGFSRGFKMPSRRTGIGSF